MNRFLKPANRSNEKLNIEIITEKNRRKIHKKEIWNILHTYSVYLDEKSSGNDIQEYKDFIYGILYFGTKKDFEWNQQFNDFNNFNPLDNVNNRNEAILWNCRFHNYVNMKTNKDLFDCKLDTISKRWGNYNKITNSEKNKF
jgi:hypothetical protein